LDACKDPQLFGDWFRKPSDWVAWFAFIAALFGLPMTTEQLQIYRECTGRTEPPDQQAEEGWLVVGRRGGKSFVLALIAVFIACFKDHRSYLAPGERGTVMVLAEDRKQTRIILRYIKALLSIPILKRKLIAETRDGIDLDNRISIEVHTASYRSTRGYAIIAALCDELAVWPTEDAAEPDYAVLNALRPGMSQFPDALLLCASSPYWQKGALYDAHKGHFGKNGDPILVWQAPTRRMNPTIPQRWVDRQIDKDPVSATAEYLAQFRLDVNGWATLELIEAAVDLGVIVRPPASGLRYVSFTDLSGGASDSSTAAVAHAEGNQAVLDAVIEIRAPHNPVTATQRISELLAEYGLHETTADKYAAGFAIDAFAKNGIRLKHSERNRSELYLECLPLLSSGRVRLVDNKRLVTQFASLERRTSSLGSDTVQKTKGMHDDVCNSAAGALVLAASRKKGLTAEMFSTSNMARFYRPGAGLGREPRTIAHLRGGLGR
jgi:hypothetical protein